MTRDDDPDETEGRKLYRLRADSIANAEASIGKRGVRMPSHSLRQGPNDGQKAFQLD